HCYRASRRKPNRCRWGELQRGAVAPTQKQALYSKKGRSGRIANERLAVRQKLQGHRLHSALETRGVSHVRICTSPAKRLHPDRTDDRRNGYGHPRGDWLRLLHLIRQEGRARRCEGSFDHLGASFGTLLLAVLLLLQRITQFDST